MDWQALRKAGVATIQNLGGWFWGGLLGGRSFVVTAAALVFTFVLAWTHRLDGTWVAALGAILGATHTRAIFGDYHEWRMGKLNGSGTGNGGNGGNH